MFVLLAPCPNTHQPCQATIKNLQRPSNRNRIRTRISNLHEVVPRHIPPCIHFPPNVNVQALSLVVLLAVEDPQDRQEEVENIEIETDSSRNFLLNRVLSKHHLDINKNVPTENDSTG